MNTANGNLVLHATDLSINGVGLPAIVDRYYNSLNQNNYNDVGMGWTNGEGSDVRLAPWSDNLTLYLPGEQPEVFMKSGGSYASPPGINATLVRTSSGHFSSYAGILCLMP